MQTRQIAVKGNIISYRTDGEGKDAIVFLHGWRSEGAAWLPAIAALGPRPEKLIIPDLPGFGMSAMSKESMVLGEYADIICALIAHEAPEGKVTIIGHSFGARVSAKIAAENPAFLSRLVLVASGGARQNPLMRGMKWFVAKCLKPFFMPSFMRPLRETIYTLIGAEDYIARLELRKTLMNVLNENIDALLPEIRVPTLVVWGDQDDMAPIAYGKKMTRLIPGAKMETLEGTGHWCFQECPEKFAHIISGFLK